MNVRAEEIAARALRDWLLLSLPAQVTAINLLRAAVIRAPYFGPYTIPAGATLALNQTPNSDTFTAIAPLTTGSRTAAQVAAEINTAMGAAVATVESVYVGGVEKTRLKLTSTTPPLVGTPCTNSTMQIRGGVVDTDCNTAFGWDAGGEKVLSTALIAPGSRGVTDGLPLQPDFGPSAADQGSPIVVIIGDRSSKPVQPPVRRDEYAVTLDLSILRVEPQQQVHRSREHIHAAVQCVRQAILSDRTLGAHLSGVMLTTETQCRIAALPFKFKDNKDSPVVSPLFDGAAMLVEVKVFEQQGA